MRKDKEKVLDEVWTEEHIRSFLAMRPHDGSDEDFHMLLKAYQCMRVSDFEQFVQFFQSESRDINAEGPGGRSVLAIVTEHRHGAHYAGILQAAGAALGQNSQRP